MASRAALLAVALPLLAASAVPARAQGAAGLFGAITDSIGLTATPKGELDYRERPPLVVPPANTLRPPQDRDVAARAPQWPKDPDVERGRRAAEEERRPVLSSQTFDPRQGAILSADEIKAGAKKRRPSTAGKGDANAAVSDFPETYGENPTMIRDGRQLNVRLSSEPELPPGVEPQRRYLTEPPRGLRQPSLAQPLGATRDRSGGGDGKSADGSSPYDFIVPRTPQ